MNDFTCVREPDDHHWAVILADQVDLAIQVSWTITTVVWSWCREYLENQHPWLLPKHQRA